MAFRLESSAFVDKAKIPSEYTGEGSDMSPPLKWSGAPPGTQEFALLVEDPDAPQEEPWVHWIAYKIPANVDTLPKNIKKMSEVSSPTRILQGQNSFQNKGYGGPMPPKKHGAHRYFFKLFALDAPLPDEHGLSKEDLLKKIEGHVLDEAQLMGTYERH